MPKDKSKLTVIPAVKTAPENAPKLFVAAYCRVSTDQDEQLSSYESQIAYYTEKISNNPSLIFSGIYADEGITGTMAKKRPSFMRMIKDCEKGKINLILTKSISRFSRNTVDCLEYIRKLKAINVGIIFEKENLNTLTMASETIVTMLGMFAQAESESISKNVQWGVRQRFKSGESRINYRGFYGYKKGEDGKPKIIPEQAGIVKRIYERYLAGDSVVQIKRDLEADKITSPNGSAEWSLAVLRYILRNEKYKGDVLMQKTFTEDVLTHKRTKNTGQLAQYYLTDNHEAIIPRELFDRVQEEAARRNTKHFAAVTGDTQTVTKKGKYSSKYALTELLICGSCGTPYRRVTWARNGKKKIVWRCINRLEHGTKFCKDSPTVEEERLQTAVMKAINTLSQNRDMLNTVKTNMSIVIKSGAAWISTTALEQRIQTLEDNRKKLIAKSAKSGGDIEQFEKEFSDISSELKTLKELLKTEQLKAVKNESAEDKLKTLFDALDSENLEMNVYNDSIVRQMVSCVRVMGKGKITVNFICGMQIDAEL